jgi:proline iminopeptidase
MRELFPLALHGGPGQGLGPNMRRAFDPARYLVVLFDQRGCGKSTPSASDPATDMSVNTTAHLVADMEKLREHFGFERWQISGGSWGCTLGLAYAEQYRERVTEIVLIAITTSRRSETNWLYGGAGKFFPEAFEQFRVAAGDPADDEIFIRYATLLADPDPQVRVAAASAWCAWEDAVLSFESPRKAGALPEEPSDWLVTFARTCAHYAVHGAFLEEGALLRDAGRLAGIPGVLIHGRRDLSCPVDTAWDLAKAWPDARLLIDDGSGHRGSEVKRHWQVSAHDDFA